MEISSLANPAKDGTYGPGSKLPSKLGLRPDRIALAVPVQKMT
jgi:hypothetical protein